MKVSEFPKEIQEKILERQVEQGNKADISVFDDTPSASIDGFDWHSSPEGWDFWQEVLEYENFEEFWMKYPPKKWCINKRRNPELIGKWFNENSDVELRDRPTVDYTKDIKDCPYLHYPKWTNASCTHNSPKEDYVEISFEVFKKHFMNAANEPKTGHYFEFTREIAKKIYDVSETTFKDKVLELVNNYISPFVNTSFIHYDTVEEMFNVSATEEQIETLKECFPTFEHNIPQKHKPFTFEYAENIIGLKVKSKDTINKTVHIISIATETQVLLGGATHWYSYQNLLDNFTFLDGSACGILN